MYIYQTRIYKAADLADFAAVGGAALPVESFVVQETAFQLDYTYAQFKALITSGKASWSNVKYLGDDLRKLYIVSTNPL